MRLAGQASAIPTHGGRHHSTVEECGRHLGGEMQLIRQLFAPSSRCCGASNPIAGTDCWPSRNRSPLQNTMQRFRTRSVHLCSGQHDSHPTISSAAAISKTEWADSNKQLTTQPSAAGAAMLPRSSLMRAALSFAAIAAALSNPPDASASKLVTLRDGSSVEAYEHGLSLAILALRGAVPAQWVMEFKQVLGKYAGFSLDQRGQLEDIFKELRAGVTSNGRSAAAADVVDVGDAWLAPAIQQGLIQPIPNATNHRWFRELSARWRSLVRRNSRGSPDPQGQVYAAPFRWGATLVAYRRDRLLQRGGRIITDWDDLLQPALRGRIAFADSSRELVGIALKTLGLGYNASATQMAAAGVDASTLQARVQELRAQALLFSNRDHVRALTAGDAWVVVGSSADLVQIAERSNNVDVLAPASGTSLWADLWVVPVGAKGGHRAAAPSPILPAWMEFCLQPARIASLPGLKGGASPLLLPPADIGSASGAHSIAHVCSDGDLRSSGVVENWTAAAASWLGGLNLPGRRTHSDDGHGLHERLHDSQHGAVHSGSRDALQEASPATGGVESATDAATKQLLNTALVLKHQHAYLPPSKVLARSEFMLPLSGEMLQMYTQALTDS